LYDVTLEEIAEEFGVSITSVWRWENGISGPGKPYASKYRELLEIWARKEREAMEGKSL
jgi:transcriptional regulator with XRE-family HTH domain